MQFKEEVNNILKKENWHYVNKQLVAKMLSEFMYEDMINPTILTEDGVNKQYEFTISEHKAYYFEAEARLFDSFDVNPGSIVVKENNEVEEPTSAIEFLLEIRNKIGMTEETTGHLIRELNHTLLADAHIRQKNSKTSDELVDLDYALIEGEMTGHPWITYNKGRVGFGYDDYLQYAPENQKLVRLYWIAVHDTRATFHSVKGLSHDELIKSELDHTTIENFEALLESKGVLKERYYFLPVHEWQWKNVIIQSFVEDLAVDAIIPLGEGPDEYLPQQSIRTFVNDTKKEKHHVKLPMSILNTLVYRGLPSERTVIAPQITEYIQGIYQNDKFLKDKCKLILLGEIASVNYSHAYYEKLSGAPYQYLELLGGIWRESIYSHIEDGEQPITLAALLHIDHNGKPFIASLIEKSCLTVEEWVSQMFNVIMPPLLHYLYQYGTVFSPHGQNTILVLKDYKPHRLCIKDFVDDVNVSDQPFPELKELSEDLKAVLRSEPPEGLTQFILTGLFICHFRYLSNILINNFNFNEFTFWRILAETIKSYQERFPHLQERFDTFDLFKPEVTKLCLNRNRMVDYGYSDDEDRPHASEYGKVRNALYKVLVQS